MTGGSASATGQRADTIKYRVVQPRKAILGDVIPERAAGWNKEEYVKIRKAFEHLGYDILEVGAVSHIWHRSNHLGTTFHSMYRHDSESIRVHGSDRPDDSIWITPYERYARFDLSKSWKQIAADIQYYFGHGSLDW